ncbi:amidase signature domain-containing protein [Lasiosphaeris hirsuta]|uniref:Amidase signature domain-containing protein n=1 Tax=Lasiosphaeris hirsuta TaxID=260670 RepID=A0AA40BDA6_9PEZI|nr:amidase signature domain-containing protein [Lasiosphaeris hirsuta]
MQLLVYLPSIASLLFCLNHLLPPVIKSWVPFSPFGPSHASAPWQDVAAEKRRRDMAKIPSEWRLPQKVIDEAGQRRSVADEFIESLLDPDSRFLTGLEVPALMEMTANGSLTAVRLTTAFCKRAAYAHQLNHNLLEIGFDSAIEQAKSLDVFREVHHRPAGPLHGLPITMKDQFHVKGMDTTMGYVGWIDSFEGNKSSERKHRDESEIVRKLRSLGAIVIAKTTLFGETNNNILGYHWNPRNQQLSSGGSSGGEGAMQALRGSALGFGSDIGGSVSMPAAFNGVFSIKPSVGRLPTLDMPNSVSMPDSKSRRFCNLPIALSPGQINIPTVAGILGPSIASLRYTMEALLFSEPWLTDPAVLPIPWRKSLEADCVGKLSFAFMDFDGVVRPHPPITRALNMVKDALQAAGHEVIPWDGPSHAQALAIHAAITSADGSYDVFEQLKLSGEPLIPQLAPDFPGSKPGPVKNAIEVEEVVLKLKKYRVDYRNYWLSTANCTMTGKSNSVSKFGPCQSLLTSSGFLGRPIDAVILPVVPSAAVIPGKLFHYDYIASANVVDYTTLVVPVTRADRSIDIPDPNYVPVGEVDKKNWEAYDAGIYHGAPAAVQVLGGRLEEEKLLAIGQVVTEALKKYYNF